MKSTPNPMRQSFLLYHEFQDYFLLLPMEERGLLITAIFEYATCGTTRSELPLGVQMALLAVRNAMDRDAAAYALRCEKNAQNGKKGGRPRLVAEKREASQEDGEVTQIAAAEEATGMEEPEEAMEVMEEPEEEIEEIEAINKTEKTEKTERFLEKPKKPEQEREQDREQEQEQERERDRDRGRERDRACARGDSVPARSRAAPIGDSVPRAVSDPVAPPLSEGERKILYEAGLEEGYIEARAERAYWTAKRSGKERSAVLAAWWQEDRGRSGWRGSNAYGGGQASPSVGDHEKSYDSDAFWEAALLRTERAMQAMLAQDDGEGTDT